MLIIAAAGALLAACAAYGAEIHPAELPGAIQQKAQELQEIQKKIQETQKSLVETQTKSASLKNELSTIQSNIKQLDLGIRSNTVQIDKLSLEIQSLQQDIAAAEEKRAVKEKGIAELLGRVQMLDAEDPLITFVRHATLAEAIDEAARLDELNADLAKTARELKELNDARAEKIALRQGKKKTIEQEHKTLKARKTIVEEKKKEQQELLTETKNQEKNYQKIVASLAERQAAIAEEIEALEAELRKRIDPNSLPTIRRGVLAMPVAGGTVDRLSQEYGATSFAIRGGYKGRWHNGIDFAGPAGTPILAADAGVVLATGNQDLYCRRGAYGKYAVIKHNNNLTTLYAHLSGIAVQPGATVGRGEVIGYMGNTGYSTGTHLHFTVYDSATFAMRGSRTCGPMPSGGDLDPRNYL
jgi:murein DD-endopeptidase MepM/ murein hydrolase activator NlpD